MKAFWISPENGIIPVSDHAEGRGPEERESFLLGQMKSGWLRARRYRNHWSLQGAWSGKSEAFKKAIRETEPDKFVDLQIEQINRSGRGLESFRTSLGKI